VERPPGKLNLDLALGADILDPIPEQMRDMRGIGRRGDCDDRFGLGNLTGGGEDRGSAEAVTDQDRGSFAGRAQMVSGADEVGDVRGEGRVGEIALARAEAGEVEPQHRDPPRRQRHRDALRRQHVLAAGEAMRKQRIGVDRAIRRIKCCGELVAAFAGELKAFGRHGRSPSNRLQSPE
jgi:hypothetical protein